MERDYYIEILTRKATSATMMRVCTYTAHTRVRFILKYIYSYGFSLFNVLDFHPFKLHNLSNRTTARSRLSESRLFGISFRPSRCLKDVCVLNEREGFNLFTM